MKASALLASGWEEDSLEVLWRDAGRAFCSLRRKDAANETHAFIPIPSGAEHPTVESVNRLTHEHGLQRYLDGSWAVRPLELVRERGQTMLVVDYPGGEPVDRFVRQPMEVGQFLRLAAPLSGAVGRLHGCGLIHKDLKPANVLVDLASGLVRLTGFGIASRLPRQRQSPAPPKFIAGRSLTWRQSRGIPEERSKRRAALNQQLPRGTRVKTVRLVVIAVLLVGKAQRSGTRHVHR